MRPFLLGWCLVLEWLRSRCEALARWWAMPGFGTRCPGVSSARRRAPLESHPEICALSGENKQRKTLIPSMYWGPAPPQSFGSKLLWRVCSRRGDLSFLCVMAQRAAVWQDIGFNSSSVPQHLLPGRSLWCDGTGSLLGGRKRAVARRVRRDRVRTWLC